MTRTVEQLPDGYEQIYEVDLQKNKKIAWFLNLGALAVGIIMGLVAHLFVPIGTLFDSSKGLLAYAIRFGVLLVGMIAYIILHEIVHGITMKAFGAPKIRYGFTGLYAFAGCDSYFDKVSYITVALAPVVVWGLVLFVLNFLVPAEWFWVVYMIQIINLSGAAGDAFVTCKFAAMPADILVLDRGTGMKVYSKNESNSAKR